MDKFNLNDQFELYLRRVGVSKEVLPPVQYTELKRAFMGAAGQLLILFRDDIAAIPNERQAVQTMESLVDQVQAYWQNEHLAADPG